MNRKGFWRDESGMTLTELMAAMAVAVILMIFITQIYVFTGSVFEKTASEDDLARMTQAVTIYLEDRISCANTLEISRKERPDTDGVHVIEFSGDGRIYFDKEPVYDAEFYRKRKVFCRILPYSGEKDVQAFKYRITWMNQKNTALYSADSVIKLINLELAGEAFVCSGGETDLSEAGSSLYFYYTEADD